MKIKYLSLKMDGMKNQGSFYCRKGYFAMNVQAMVDRNKRVVWRSILYRGSEHDSTAFKRSQLYKTLLSKTLFLSVYGGGEVVGMGCHGSLWYL